MNKKTLSVLTTITLLASASNVFAAPINFKDVPVTHWAKATIDWGTNKKIVAGYPDGTFKPENKVKESEFLVMLVSSFQGKQEKTGPHWASGYYTFAEKMNYGTFGAKSNEAKEWMINRQQVAEIIAAANGVNYTGKDAVKYLLANGLAKGKNPGEISVESFKPQDYLSRAEAIQIIKGAMEKGLKELKVRPQEPSTVTEEMKKIPDKAPVTQPQTPQGNGNITVVPPANPGQLLPKDPTTEPAVKALLNSLQFKDGKVTGTVPELPQGYGMTLTYEDSSDGKWGNRKYDKDFTSLKSGQQFSAEVVGKGGSIIFAVYKGNVGKNGVVVNLPSMTAQWESAQ